MVCLTNGVRAVLRCGVMLVLASVCLMYPHQAHAQPAVGTAPGIGLLEEGSDQGRILRLNCIGTTITCARSGTTGSITDSGAGGSSVNSVATLSTIGTIGIGSATVYLIPGDVSASVEMQAPIMGSTYRNLRCVADATPGGSGISVTGRFGACSAAELATSSSLTVTVTTANTEVADAVNTMAPTVGQCLQFKVVGASTTLAARVTCTVERSA